MSPFPAYSETLWLFFHKTAIFSRPWAFYFHCYFDLILIVSSFQLWKACRRFLLVFLPLGDSFKPNFRWLFDYFLYLVYFIILTKFLKERSASPGLRRRSRSSGLTSFNHSVAHPWSGIFFLRIFRFIKAPRSKLKRNSEEFFFNFTPISRRKIFAFNVTYFIKMF